MQWWQHVLRIIILSVIYHKHLLPLSLLPPWAMKTAEWSLILKMPHQNIWEIQAVVEADEVTSSSGYERGNSPQTKVKISYSCHMWPIIQRKKYFIIETVSYLFVSQLMECLSLQQLCGELKNICYGANPAMLNFKFFWSTIYNCIQTIKLRPDMESHHIGFTDRGPAFPFLLCGVLLNPRTIGLHSDKPAP